jgi:general stress protein 26
MTDVVNHIQKLNELIKDTEVAMLTTSTADGTLHSRPMVTQDVDPQGSLWFLTRKDSSKISEVQSERHVNVSFAEPKDSRFVSVSGTVELVEDRKKIEQVWNPMYKAWFPRGLEDPEIVLIKVLVSEAEYWDTPNGKMVQLAGFVKAAATGKPYHPSEDEHAKIDFETGRKTA